MHKIILPLTLVYTALVVYKLPMPIPLPILLVPLIPPGIVLLDHELTLIIALNRTRVLVLVGVLLDGGIVLASGASLGRVAVHRGRGLGLGQGVQEGAVGVLAGCFAEDVALGHLGLEHLEALADGGMELGLRGGLEPVGGPVVQDLDPVLAGGPAAGLLLDVLQVAAGFD